VSSLAGGRLALTFGRQEWKYGDERLVGGFGWDNVGRAFDGFKGRVSSGKWFVDTLAARVSSLPRSEELSAPGSGATTGATSMGLRAPRAE